MTIPNMVTLILLGSPVPKARPRVTGHHTYTPKGTQEAEENWRAVWFQAGRPSYRRAVPLTVHMVFTLSRPGSVRTPYPVHRPDLDNYIKLVLDALMGCVWPDDAQIIKLSARKVYATMPQTQLWVWGDQER